MNYALRNIVLIFIFFFILFFGYYYLFSRQQGQYIPESWAELDCIHPILVSTDDLQPPIKKGVILSLNQCIPSKSSLQIGYIIRFELDSRKRLGIITDIEKEGREVSYIVSTSNLDEIEYTVPSQQALAYTVIE